MKIKATTIYEQNAQAWLSGKRRALNEGGTRASKTWSILQLLILITQYAKQKFLTSVISESIPHLKRGAMRDFFDILGETQQDNPCWNKTDFIYTFGLGVIEFFSADDSRKLRGAGRDILFINEANNVSYDAYLELDIRTKLFTFLDWNPVSEFWAHEKLKNLPDSAYIHSTFMDVIDVLPQSVIDNIKAKRYTDPNWYNIYGLGNLGKVEGRVYPYFEQVDHLPLGEVFYGLDFGYSNDPTSLIRCRIDNGGLYCEELIYEAGLTNDAIAYRMDELGVKRNYDEIFADSAEPKSIDEIHKFAFNIKPCSKGPGSVEYGHQKVRQYKQFWTKDSLECIKEQRNFRYIQDKNGKFTDKTTHMFSHGMDARRYALVGYMDKELEPVEKVIIYDTMEAVKGLELG